ncbi:hypothetical protein CBL_20904, partial [Carabus blaptoides fortunei]
AGKLCKSPITIEYSSPAGGKFKRTTILTHITGHVKEGVSACRDDEGSSTFTIKETEWWCWLPAVNIIRHLSMWAKNITTLSSLFLCCPPPLMALWPIPGDNTGLLGRAEKREGNEGNRAPTWLVHFEQ